MIDYRTAPSADEIEITLFGPGYGEAIAIHLGGGAWLLVDSCIDPNVNAPASAEYLQQIHVEPRQVRTIVASHWHDDHVRGISQLATMYPTAEFMLSAVFNDKVATSFLAAYNGAHSTGLARGAKELFTVVNARGSVYPTQHRSLVIDETINSRPVKVTALSPMPAAFCQTIAYFAQYLPQKGKAINNAPNPSPNFQSIVLHIGVADDAILLGADLEDHECYGWTAVIADRWSGNLKPATAYKVSHHGSHTSDNPNIWKRLLQTQPMACVTPFGLGRVRLPSDHDRKRLQGSTLHAYITSGASRSPKMDVRHLKRLLDVAKNVMLVDTGFGAVRFRKTIGASSWGVELFGAAQKL